MIARRVIFSGRVQGVGFRYKTQEIARNYAVSGYVKNLPDGSVEVTCEGDAATLTSFIEQIKNSMARYIKDVQVEESQVQGQSQFVISY